MATEYEWGSKTSLPKKARKPEEFAKWDREYISSIKNKISDGKLGPDSPIITALIRTIDSLENDIAYLRGVIRDCLVLAGCEPSRPRAERRIHGIDFVVSILDALRSAYDATKQYPDKGKEEIESVIREKIRKGMEDGGE